MRIQQRTSLADGVLRELQIEAPDNELKVLAFSLMDAIDQGQANLKVGPVTVTVISIDHADPPVH